VIPQDNHVRDVLFSFLLPTFRDIDAGLGACRAENSEISWSRCDVCRMTIPMPLVKL